MSFESVVINSQCKQDAAARCRQYDVQPGAASSPIWMSSFTVAEILVLQMSATAERSLHLAPLAGRGRIASSDAIRVRGYRSIERAILRQRPSPHPLPARAGRGSERAVITHAAPLSSIALKSARARCASVRAMSDA